MIRYVLLLLVIIFIALFLRLNNDTAVKTPSPSPQFNEALPAKQPTPSPTLISVNSIQYAIYSQVVTNSQNLTLIPNFTQKLSSQSIVSENKCLYGINSGFYTKENTPLGLFKSGNQVLNRVTHQNDLFNGFVYKTKSNQLFISIDPPVLENTEITFQSGPLFGPETKLNIKSDEPARRMVIGKTQKNQFYFLAITEAENTYSGPFLKDLPSIINLYNQQLKIKNQNLTTLINLDGGSASAFYSDQGQIIGELTTVGSFFCGK